MRQAWKVLIADDEPIIREGIKEAVDWEAMQMAVVAEAEDGKEALDLALAHSIDILLVDLNMPIMNGMTLIRHVRERLPECRVVIVTGHDEFAYAQEAIRLNVDDYILKPANPDQLTQVLEKVRAELEAETKQKKLFDMASKQIIQNLPLLRERFCQNWIEGDMTEEEIAEHLQFLQLPSACPKSIGIIHWTEFYGNQPLLKESDRQLFLFAIENIILEILQPYEKVLFRDSSGLIVVCLWERVPEETLAQVGKSIETCLKIAVTLHFEPVEGGLTGVAAAYSRCKEKIYNELNVSPIVRRARQYIRDHFSDADLTLESMAESLQVSPVYLSRMLKQELGASFINLITQTRIKEAVYLLNSTDLPIHEISERVGYKTQHYFSTAFKKIMGLSPNQYRKGVSLSEQAQAKSM